MMKNLKFLRENSFKGIYILTVLLLFGLKIFAQNQTIPGKVVLPYPTIINLAVEWNIEGDDNQNGIVLVQFREKGHAEWRQGMTLRRIPAGENLTALTLSRKTPGFTGFDWVNKHSGSIFDLKPDTEYEIKLKLEDPDGGSAEKIVRARTRPVPQIDNHAEIIEIQPGKYDTLHTKSGTAGKPVVYRCSKGKATFKFIDIQNKQWVFIDGLDVKNLTSEGIGICLNGAENCVVRNCTINSVWGIVAYLPGATNCYFSDNVITGISEWTEEAMGADGKNIGEGIEITGPGNVICYNKVTGFRDCISLMEDEYVINQVCNDIYNNDIYKGADDGIEADFCFSNCRIFRNRLTNCFVGLSSQPGLGGPDYFVRNVMYNVVHAAFKLKRFSQGDVVLHNTVIKVGTGLGGNSKMDYAYFRNNLAIGGPTGGVNWGGGDYGGAGNPYAADIIDHGNHSSFDYDAVGVFGTPYLAMIGGKPFSDVEKHGVEQIKLENTFNKVEFPNPPIPERKVPDLRLKPGSKAIDAAMLIPNINDDFKGKAPDCGAYELDQELPHYGPRTMMPFHEVKVNNPVFIANTAFLSFEDLSSPKFEALKEKYQLDTIFHGEKDELKRILLMRNWIRKIITISDFEDSYPGNNCAEGILDEALKGQGFHCAHFSVVQNAIMNAYGYVTRCIGAGPGEANAPYQHHGINEIWLNSYNKWFLSDAKYNHHFERNGIPLSALEIRDEYLKNKAADLVLVKGTDKIPIEYDMRANEKGEMKKVSKETFAQTYTWVSWPKHNDKYTNWPNDSNDLIMYDDEYFKNHTWLRDGKPHWAYNTEYLNLISDRKKIEWTPNTISTIVKIDGNKAKIELNSNTPNLKTYQMKELPGEGWKDISDFIEVELKRDKNEMAFRAINLAGVTGTEYKVIIER